MLWALRSVTVLLCCGVFATGAPKRDKMEPMLRSLVDAWQHGGKAGWKKQAADLPFRVDHRRVALRVTLRCTDCVEHVRKAVARLGGVSQAGFEEYLYVAVPARALGALSDNRDIAAMHLDVPEVMTRQ